MCIMKDRIRVYLNVLFLSITFLSLGLLIGFSNSSDAYTSGEEVLEEYPLDLSMSTIHRHQTHIVEKNEPDVELVAHQDEIMPNHFNLEIKTENFEFAPKNISESHIDNKGHAHVYVDDSLISRSYGNWYHLNRLKPGNHTIRVTLNTNQHDEYADSNGTIQDQVEVNVPG